MNTSKTFAVLFCAASVWIGTSVAFAQDDYEQWKKAEGEKYQQWKDARDKEFTEFLKTEWKQFQAFKEQTLFDTPKPTTIPVAPARKTVKTLAKPKPDQKPDANVKLKPEVKPEEKVEKQPEAVVSPKPDVKPEVKPEEKPVVKELPRPEVRPEVKAEEPLPAKDESKPVVKPIVKVESVPESNLLVDPEKNPNNLTMDFFEAAIAMMYGNGMTAHLDGPPGAKTISAFWEAMSKSNYDDFLKQAQLYKQKMNLNDWGYCEFINKTAEKLYPGSRNESNMFDWFMLTKSGYQAKIGYSGDNVYLLLPTSGVLYGVAYYMFGTSTTKFYNVMFDRYEKPDIGRLYSYDQDYPNATKLTSCQIDLAPSIHRDIRTRTLKFTHNGTEYTVKVEYDKSAVSFYTYYPQTNLAVYFDAVPSPDARTSLLSALKPLIKDCSETEAVDLLLHFVQTAFKYETDDQQFGREKPFFPEETLFYPASDCEDRAVLFSFLVRNLLGLDVIGLEFPNHVATAVRFKGDVSGDQVVYQNRKYIICDPTYINADYGMCMPQFKNIKPDVIALK